MFEGEGGGWMLLVLLVLDLNGPKVLYIFSTTKEKDSSPTREAYGKLQGSYYGKCDRKIKIK